MQMNEAKTEMKFLGKGDQKFNMHLNGQQLAQTDNFVYLSGVINMHGSTEADVMRKDCQKHFM